MNDLVNSNEQEVKDKLDAFVGEIVQFREDLAVKVVDFIVPIMRDRIKIGRVDVDGSPFGEYRKDDEKYGDLKGEFINFYDSGETLDKLSPEILKSTQVSTFVAITPSEKRNFVLRKLLKGGFKVINLSPFESLQVEKFIAEGYLAQIEKIQS